MKYVIMLTGLLSTDTTNSLKFVHTKIRGLRQKYIFVDTYIRGY